MNMQAIIAPLPEGRISRTAHALRGLKLKVIGRNMQYALVAAAFLLLSVGNGFAGGVKIVANPSIKIDSVTADELKSVFLEETGSLRDGSRVEPVLQRANATHDAFCREFLRRNVSEMHTYYLGLAFTGKGSVPREFNSDAEVLAYVAKTKGAIGYVNSASPTDGLKILNFIPEQKTGERALLTRVEPQYPEVLQALKVGGMVRLELTISPRGSVESASLLGGNPILGEAAIAAVRGWVYAPAPSRTTLEVSLTFDPKR